MAVCACRTWTRSSQQKSQVLSFVKGERYSIGGRFINYIGPGYLAMGLVRKSDVGVWNSLSGETQTVRVQYKWLGDILRVNLGEATAGRYKLEWNIQPYDKPLSYGSTNVWIDVNTNPANTLNNHLASTGVQVTATRGAHLGTAYSWPYSWHESTI